MKILIGASNSKIFHLKEFEDTLQKFNIETKLVSDINVVDAFPSRNLKKWIKPTSKIENIVEEFKPDLILADQPKHFALKATESKIPLILHLRGDFWSEITWARETLYKFPHKRFVLKKWENIAKKCFENSSVMLPICKFLETRMKEFYPQKPSHVFYQGISSERWFPSKGMNLKHPCVGFLQGAVIWGKSKEMLTLSQIIKKNPNITFYWAGDGPYRERILSVLKKFENFKWLGPLKYPDQVRNFLQEIDVYGLASGIDMSPLTLLEAQLMKKPVISTNVGGIPELMKDTETGYLVDIGNYVEWNKKINLILDDQKTSKRMGELGRKYVVEKFNWEKITEDFLKMVHQKFQLK
jgi:glycosyltransferase involved in cell wall biosynthesis